MPVQDELQLAVQCKALGDPIRLKILCLLPKSPNCEHRNNVSQLSELLGLTQPTVSHHLKVLKYSGLIECKKMCRDVFYWLNEERAAEFFEQLGEVFTLPDGAESGSPRDPSALNAPGSGS